MSETPTSPPPRPAHLGAQYNLLAGPPVASCTQLSDEAKALRAQGFDRGPQLRESR